MKILKHENFIDSAANLILNFERIARWERTLYFPHEEYGAGVTQEEWLKVVGKQSVAHRPVIITMDDGVRANALSQKAMKESGCVFIFLLKKWSDEPFSAFAWKIIKTWPDIVITARSCHSAGKSCRIDVTTNGKIHFINF